MVQRSRQRGRPARPRPARASDDVSEAAAGQVIAFMVGGAIFMAAIGAILYAGNGASAPIEGVETQGRGVQASSLLDLLVGSGGYGDADDLQRLGLAANDSALDPARLAALRGAAQGADPDNGLVDYDEAVQSLELGDLRFHLRIYPVGLDDSAPELADLRVAYIGDWTNLPNLKVAVGTQAAMLASAQAKIDANMATDAQRERAALAAIGVDFTNAVHLTAAAPTLQVDLPLGVDPPLLSDLGLSLVEGDVYPDQQAYLTVVLAPRLSLYDVIVVGSGVGQQALAPNTIKDAIADWVVDGGTLVVLGTDEKDEAWLNPLFQSAIRTVNGGPFAPDIAHPLLLEPNDLDWESYDNEGRVWDLKQSGGGAHYDDFTHVVVVGEQDILAVSNDGTFGDGRIVITTYQPGDIVEHQGQAEAEDLLENIFLYTQNDRLYLEYGPLIPRDAEVVTALRQSSLWDPVLGPVPVRIELHLWRETSG